MRGFFDTLEHGWLLKFLEHRIADRRVLRLIRKWLKAGVLEEGEWSETDEGTPQGAVISPLLANVYLHYVLDLWNALCRESLLGTMAPGDSYPLNQLEKNRSPAPHLRVKSGNQRLGSGILRSKLYSRGLTFHP
jgi:retron-type reverse transcriptase